MAKYRIPFSIYSSTLLVLFIFSCGAIKRSRFVPSEKHPEIHSIRFVPFSESSVFKTDILIRKNQLSGLAVFKQTAPGVWRIVFLNEIGMKFFDFKLTKNSFDVIECYQGLNRKKLLSLLERDFRLLLIPPEYPGQVHSKTGKNDAFLFLDHPGNRHQNWNIYYFSDNTILPERIESYGITGKKVTISFQSYRRNRPESFVINHNDIKLKLHFKLLDN